MAKYQSKETAKVENEVEEVSEVKKARTAKVEKKKFAQTDGVTCRSVVQGGVYLTGSKSKIPYSWSDYGDRTDVEYYDLVSLVHERSGYIFNPFIIIEDEDFIAEFPQLQKFYSENYSIKDLSDILALDTVRMEEAINTLPKTAMDSLKKVAANQVSLGQIDSVAKIKALDRIFGTDLNLISEVMQ